MDLAAIRSVLFDIDGVLYRGRTALPGVAELLTFLEDRQIRYACITNNSAHSPAEIASTLTGMGISMRADAILSSAMATAVVLRRRFAPGTAILAVGSTALHTALFDDDYFVRAVENVQAVVQGADETFCYRQLRVAARAIRAGAAYYLTNPDATVPSEGEFIPDAGAIAAAITAASGSKPIVIGKPEPVLFRMAMRHLGAEPATTLMLGDRLDTDMAGARRAGIHGALLLTGATSAPDLARAARRPAAVFDDLDALLAHWRSAATPVVPDSSVHSEHW